MIPQIERVIFEKIDYVTKYLHLREKYSSNGTLCWIFKKSDVLQVFDELNYKVEYIKGGAYIIKKIYDKYCFEYRFIITKNDFSIYLYIYIDDKLLKERVSNIASVLRYIPYDIELAEKINVKGVVLDTRNDLKNYLIDIISLLDEFVFEYVDSQTAQSL